MKTRIVICLYGSGVSLAILVVWAVLSSQIYASPFLSVSSSPVSSGGLYSNTFPMMTMFPSPQFPLHPGQSLISAQRACMRTVGWNWRNGGFAMCFKSGHDACPTGHLWMRQITQHYTVCLSLNDHPAWMPPGISIN